MRCCPVAAVDGHSPRPDCCSVDAALFQVPVACEVCEASSDMAVILLVKSRLLRDAWNLGARFVLARRP